MGMSESPQMLTVPRSGRPGRGTMVRSWSSGRLGKEGHVSSLSGHCARREDGGKGVLVTIFYFYFLFTFIDLLLP